MARPVPERSAAGPRPPVHSGLLRDAARWEGRTVGLYGGSFNPGHEGHLHVALEALKRLPVDAVWLMVSPGNPLKDDTDMAPFDARLESARELADRHPGLFASDVENRLGTRYTAETVRALRRFMPKTSFIWMMGADNMATFHLWRDWQDIAMTVPIAIFDRPQYSQHGLSGHLAQRFAANRVPARMIRADRAPAWAFLTIPRHPASATLIRQALGREWHSPAPLTGEQQET
ncbi:nicotinate (nicotinamide) nucleotide adenylyltransferase [Eilatimonas milleporae]|uniref:Probable nicotinate-nucleotide adenylyltransferase n=1 Tax=Eilatimonas milleporae TaxID=911205 RepID=A0A3M0CDI8_9PROT|nr:nicotinate (nicotinamide) nucleotide adenylyltransferase [Eilatimonas milleporae]RMB07894.1 nicotinate-nucleotide adenylyltransferase [Eilatimonas milleporae]